jgi:signal transduction histidine kinase
MTSKPEGTGLGLTIARAIMLRHGGRLGFEAEYAGGTRVVLVLPVAPPSDAEPPLRS